MRAGAYITTGGGFIDPIVIQYASTASVAGSEYPRTLTYRKLSTASS
jgi:hypothetical protein